MMFRENNKEENGAFMLVEATILYPIVFLIIAVLLYVGLYILQLSTLSAYAQKIAVLSAREVSYPGYRNILSQDKYSTSAVEADFGKSVSASDETSPYSGKINIDNHVENVALRAYRYWYNPLNDDEKSYYETILINLVRQNSILTGDSAGSVNVKITCDNYVITQFITVTIDQELMEFPVLTFFGIDRLKATASAVAPVSDTDELVRNTDFAVDAVEVIANKFGLDTTKIKTTVKSGLKKLGLTQ